MIQSMIAGVSAKADVSISPKVVITLGRFPITETMVSALVTTLVLVLFALAVRIFCIPRWRKSEDKPSAFRLAVEGTVRFFDRSAHEHSSPFGSFVGSFCFACSLYIVTGTLTDLLGLRPPTSDLNATLVLGAFTVALIFVYGFRRKRARRLLHYCNPIYLVTDAAVLLSLALHVFVSVLTGYVLVHLLYSLPYWAQVGLPAIASIFLTVAHAFIQGYVFMFLSVGFIGEAIG